MRTAPGPPGTWRTWCTPRGTGNELDTSTGTTPAVSVPGPLDPWRDAVRALHCVSPRTNVSAPALRHPSTRECGRISLCSSWSASEVRAPRIYVCLEVSCGWEFLCLQRRTGSPPESRDTPDCPRTVEKKNGICHPSSCKTLWSSCRTCGEWLCRGRKTTKTCWPTSLRCCPSTKRSRETSTTTRRFLRRNTRTQSPGTARTTRPHQIEKGLVSTPCWSDNEKVKFECIEEYVLNLFSDSSRVIQKQKQTR